jgi:hypothetical protein
MRSSVSVSRKCDTSNDSIANPHTVADVGQEGKQ